MNNPFEQLKTKKTKKAKIKALGGAEIEYRELTLGEEDVILESTLKGYDKDGKPITDIKGAMEVKFKKASYMLVNPKMTVNELKALNGSQARDAIQEIISLVEDDGFDEEGNSKS